jgi:hypothetical protein
VPSAAKVAVTGDAACTEAADAAGAKATCASGEATDVAPTKSAHVTSAEATAHVTSAKTTAHVAAAAKAAAAAMAATTTTAAAAGFGTGSKQAAGEYGTRQNHHHSSSHDILLWDGRTVRRRSFQTPTFSKGKRQRRDGVKMAMQMPRLH